MSTNLLGVLIDVFVLLLRLGISILTTRKDCGVIIESVAHSMTVKPMTMDVVLIASEGRLMIREKWRHRFVRPPQRSRTRPPVQTRIKKYQVQWDRGLSRPLSGLNSRIRYFSIKKRSTRSFSALIVREFRRPHGDCHVAAHSLFLAGPHVWYVAGFCPTVPRQSEEAQSAPMKPPLIPSIQRVQSFVNSRLALAIEHSNIWFTKRSPQTGDMASVPHQISSSRNQAHENPTTLEGIEAAIRQSEIALNLAASQEDQHPAFQAVHHDRLADLYYSKYGLTRNSSDRDAAKSLSGTAGVLGKQATQNNPPGYSKAAQWCAIQGSRLSVRFERFGEKKDLDDAIDIYEEALEALTEGSSLRSIILMNQANCLCTRYEEEGSVEDIEDAIRKAREALTTAGTNTATIQNDLSTMYLSKYERDKVPEDLEESLKLSKSAVDRTAQDDPKLPTRLVNRAIALNARYESLEEIKWIEDTIETLEKAEASARTGNAACLPQILSRLAGALYVRYRRTRTSSDILAALEKGKEALQLIDDNPHHDDRKKLNKLLHTCSEEARELEDDEEEVREGDCFVEV
ncbi:uncharacterized protein BDR25DRAFT_341395 [Lindgomyces ingoldianus]|uniref:Uncharacterized protein n=1 Tax=Lindgomyces ingoldianus TaxID=673940 RepID=A0ACB6R3B0_9PLEO|nr:uncharacterized protein BDR25DRAFT_341395 [Lindgomyces ingoldianus]KAF2473275.1 hypothetical protein BDR25DRAFT_341395 [Lindgomyces ingoldianus]